MAPAHCDVSRNSISTLNILFESLWFGVLLKKFDFNFYFRNHVRTYLNKCFLVIIWKLRNFCGFFIKILPPVCPLVSWRYAVMSLSPIRFNEAETTILLSFTSMASVDAFLRKQVLNGPRIIDDVIHPTCALLCTYHLWLWNFSYLTIIWVIIHAWMIF